MGHFHRIEGFGERADLIGLDQDGIGHIQTDALRQPRGIGHEQVIADKLHAVADALCELLPAAPVVLGHAVLDGKDGIIVHQRFQIIHHAVGIEHMRFLAREVIDPVLVELA